MFCALAHVFGGTEASGPVFMFCALRLILGGTEGVGSSFHVLRSRTRFRRNRGHRVPFSYFEFLDSFGAVPSVSGAVVMFCAPRPVLGGTEVVGSSFHVFHSRTRLGRFRGRQVMFSCFTLPDSFSAVPRLSGPVFKFCALGLVFGGTEGAGYRF
jgi:hypothetical protein